jgi:predicted ATPase/class 3 adenylate cyclase
MADVNQLPDGTVSLLFSDIEGSTVLLSRLGPAYADALDGQRRVLRKAWGDHGGTEMGTEGDSFFVVFPTAEGAVTAATQAQRELAGYEWPAGEQVRVRMGIHTGTPAVHDGGYVGMDVHRAARIAGAAHGGQVVLSSATAELASPSLPDGLWFRDLGLHQLKDIPVAEHVFQLSGEGLESDFGALRSLGTATSLPTPATPTVGRDGELAELAVALGSPDIRLLTLTGPGGSGKTRLAVEAARRAVPEFPDGIFFVPLAAVTSAAVMWTSIAEALNIPPEGRIPPGLFTHVAHRSALLVLDNLEQLDAADEVVAELLDEAPSVMVIATSRRPLHLSAEYEHEVPPLELPEDSSLEAVEGAGAVRMFESHARKVRSGFAVTAANAGDVAEICRRLDGLPLAIEIAASRSKLFSPKAILSRLDDALDMAAAGSRGEARQKTLRDAIDWSYRLLAEDGQRLFRHLGVFAGGAGLDAIAAVYTGDQGPAGPGTADLVGQIVDASLAAVTEAPDGEPRVHVLETLRAYAIERLTAENELHGARRRHAGHFLRFAEVEGEAMFTADHLRAANRLELEHDNVRQALKWCLAHSPADRPRDASGARIDLGLCANLGAFWAGAGYVGEARHWLVGAVEGDASEDDPLMARCLRGLSILDRTVDDLEAAREHAARGLDVSRRMSDPVMVAKALTALAGAEVDSGNGTAARPMLEEAVAVLRAVDEPLGLAFLLEEFGRFEEVEGHYESALAMHSEAAAISEREGSPNLPVDLSHVATALRLLGRLDEAAALMRDVIAQLLDANAPGALSGVAEEYAILLADLGHHVAAATLLGSAHAADERQGSARSGEQAAEIADATAKARNSLPDAAWQAAYQAGRDVPIDTALIEAARLDPPS